MRSCTYRRVSLEEQAQSGLSLTNQGEKTASLAKIHDWEIVDEIEDAGFSAATPSRPGLQKVLDLVRNRRIDILVIFKLDRLTRNQRDLLNLLAEFERFSVRLVSVCENLDTSSASGRFFISMLGAIAQWERETVGERTKAAIEQLRRQKRRFSRHAPYGWKYTSEGRMMIDEMEQVIIGLVRSLATEGCSLRQIGRELVKRGYAPRNAKSWHPKVLSTLVSAG